MSVLIKGGRIVTASDDYVGDVYVENGTVSLHRRGARRPGGQGRRRDGKDRHAGRDRPAYPSRDGVRRHRHLRRLHLGHRVGGVRRHDAPDRLLHAGARARRSRGARELPREDRALQAGHRRRLPYRRHRPAATAGTLEDLAKLPDEGITSYKLFMAYKGAVMVDDETLFRTMQVACRTGALVMVHAENGDAIDVLVKEAVAEGKTEPIWHARTRPPDHRGRGDEPRHPARAGRRRAALRRPRLLQGGDRAHRAARGQGLAGLGRDVHAVPVHRRDGSRAARLRRREVRLHAAASTEGEPGAPLACARPDVLSVVSTDHCPFNWDGQKTLGRDDFSKIPNGGPGIENRLHMLHHFGVREGRLSLNRFVELDLDERREAVRPLPAQGHDRAGLRRRHRRLGS